MGPVADIVPSVYTSLGLNLAEAKNGQYSPRNNSQKLMKMHNCP